MPTTLDIQSRATVINGHVFGATGAYEIAAANGKAKVSLFASGSEVALAIEAKKLLDANDRKRDERRKEVEPA